MVYCLGRRRGCARLRINGTREGKPATWSEVIDLKRVIPQERHCSAHGGGQGHRNSDCVTSCVHFVLLFCITVPCTLVKAQ